MDYVAYGVIPRGQPGDQPGFGLWIQWWHRPSRSLGPMCWPPTAPWDAIPTPEIAGQDAWTLYRPEEVSWRTQRRLAPYFRTPMNDSIILGGDVASAGPPCPMPTCTSWNWPPTPPSPCPSHGS